jgi:hypothetical protein
MKQAVYLNASLSAAPRKDPPNPPGTPTELPKQASVARHGIKMHSKIPPHTGVCEDYSAASHLLRPLAPTSSTWHCQPASPHPTTQLLSPLPPPPCTPLALTSSLACSPDAACATPNPTTWPAAVLPLFCSSGPGQVACPNPSRVCPPAPAPPT